MWFDSRRELGSMYEVLRRYINPETAKEWNLVKCLENKTKFRSTDKQIQELLFFLLKERTKKFENKKNWKSQSMLAVKKMQILSENNLKNWCKKL